MALPKPPPHLDRAILTPGEKHRHAACKLPDRIAEAAQNLPLVELDALVERLLTLRARQHAPTLSQAEADLLQRIQDAVPLTTRQQRKGLHALSQQRLLTDDETAEADRINLLAQLAALRGVTLPEVARQLGIRCA